ncbi:MAG: hypothetical protein WD156_10445 [Acidimicrobiia bacterium]
MNDMRDEIRSAIAEMVDETPGPAPFHQVAAGRTRHAGTWAGPRLAAAAFTAVVILIGAVAVIRPQAETPSPLAGLPGLESDVEGPPLDGGFAIPSHLPDGFEPIAAEHRWMAPGFALRFADQNGAEVSVRAGDDLTGMSANFESATVADRLANAYPDLTIAETTVRGQAAFVLDGGDADTEGWTSAVVVIESPTSVSRVLGFGVPAAEILAVARGLEAADFDAYEQWAVEAIDSHLHVTAWVSDPDAFTDAVASAVGVAEVRLLRDDSGRGSDPVFVLMADDPDQSPTTTATVGSDTTVVAVDESVMVRLEVTLDDPALAESVAEAISGLGSGHVAYSPAVARMVTEAYLSEVLAGAAIVHEDPTILQPAQGPEPRFDVTDLGEEAPLHPATETLSTSEVADVDTMVPGRSSEGRTLQGPILHIGSLDEGARLVLTFDGGADYIERTLHDDGWNGGAASLGNYSYGVTGHGSSSVGPTYVQVRVPLDTAVVVLTLDDGSRVWQRPIAGHGLLPVDHPGGSELDATVTALAADGTVIGVWESSGSG